MPSLSVIIPVGPDEEHVEGTREVIESLRAFEPSVRQVLLLDDGTSGWNLKKKLALDTPFEIAVMPNPRPRDASPLWGGLCQAMLHALDFTHRNFNSDLVLRIDCDALPIAPFADKLSAAFAAHPDVGMAGSMSPNAAGKEQTWGWKFWGDATRKFLRRYSHWPDARRQKRRTSLLGGGRIIRQRIQAALANGHTPGEHCAGGAYVLHRRFLDHMAENKWFADARHWRYACMSEDVMMALYVRAAGLQMLSLVNPGEPFAIEWKGLCGSPQWLVENGYSLIHSIKNDRAFSRQEILAFYRQRRGEAGDFN